MTTTMNRADRRRGPKSRWARRLNSLEVGEHFTAPLSERHLISSTAHAWGKRLGRKFSTERRSDKSMRVSRTA